MHSGHEEEEEYLYEDEDEDEAVGDEAAESADTSMATLCN